MRYRLRTLLILLTIGPLILALGWWEYGKYVERKRLAEAQARERAAIDAALQYIGSVQSAKWQCLPEDVAKIPPEPELAERAQADVVP